MVTVRMENRPAFAAVGRSVWISGQDNEQFGAFWQRAAQEGWLEELQALGGVGPATGSAVFGVSRVEDDPANRAFHFFIAAEWDGDCPAGFERFVVPAARWAVFANKGPLPQALIDAEMHCFLEWLPASGLVHAAAPELEVYPPDGSVEFWLPVAAAHVADRS